VTPLTLLNSPQNAPIVFFLSFFFFFFFFFLDPLEREKKKNLILEGPTGVYIFVSNNSLYQ
jgi:hypothetical protein